MAKGGDLVGQGNLVHRSGRLAYAEANIFDGMDRKK